MRPLDGLGHGCLESYFLVDSSLNSAVSCDYRLPSESAEEAGRVPPLYQRREQKSKMLSGWPKVMELILHGASAWTSLPASEFIAPLGGSVFSVPGCQVRTR